MDRIHADGRRDKKWISRFISAVSRPDQSLHPSDLRPSCSSVVEKIQMETRKIPCRHLRFLLRESWKAVAARIEADFPPLLHFHFLRFLEPFCG
jgi:hypothetical protein